MDDDRGGGETETQGNQERKSEIKTESHRMRQMERRGGPGGFKRTVIRA
jgi:hypothetical protein